MLLDLLLVGGYLGSAEDGELGHGSLVETLLSELLELFLDAVDVV